MDTTRHADEPRRLELLQMLDLLNADPDPAFDRLARIAASVTTAEIAMVTFLAGDRQWIRARVGTLATEARVEDGFCACTLSDDGLFEIPDATLDPRFAGHAFVLGPRAIRSYAGLPIR